MSALSAAEWVERIDTELAANQADRDAHPADASIAGLVQVGKLPAEALDWRPEHAA